MASPVTSLPPREPPAGHARILILGSMPGVASLTAQQYYAHPRNRFWPLMQALFGVPLADDYDTRVTALNMAGVALWDVLHSCERPGSLDSRIVRSTEVPNDIAGLLARHAALEVIALNGSAARDAFRRSVAPTLGARLDSICVLAMPSTSPANAAVGLDALRGRWTALTGRRAVER